ncbi:MAG TPA: hypothetical protein VFR81_16835 [Longimicrobium sp.]|nr:hypothetical protein [Longimicrobium sp.]
MAAGRRARAAWRAPSARRAPSPGDPSPGDPFDVGPYAPLRRAARLPSPVEGAAWRRALAGIAVAWAPLLLLSTLGGVALRPGHPRESFLLDVSAHARYLVALPLLLAAEPWCVPRLAEIARHFAAAGLVAPADRERFRALVASARVMLRRRGVEVLLVAAAYAGTVVLRGILYPRGVPTWVAPDAPAGLSPAGWWRALVSQPLFLLVAAVWMWRLAAWARFLWGVSRLRLRLVSSHPDLAAGLRFAGGSLPAFAPAALALSSALAGTMAEEILFVRGGPGELSRVAAAALGAAAVSLCVFAGPLLVFAGPLWRARTVGTMTYGALAGRVGRRFERRWLRPGPVRRGGRFDESDFSATADLYAVAAGARRVGLLPAGVAEVAPLVLAALLPFVPIAFLVLPVDELLGRLAGLLL